jgi:hypothetical protein
MVVASRETQVRHMKTACTFEGRSGKVGVWSGGVVVSTGRRGIGKTSEVLG